MDDQKGEYVSMKSGLPTFNCGFGIVKSLEATAPILLVISGWNRIRCVKVFLKADGEP